MFCSIDTPCLDLEGMRQVVIKVDCIEQSDGSACVSQGQTSVLAAVNGPVEVKPHRELTDKASIEVYCRSKSGLQDSSDKTMEYFLSQTCEQALMTHLHPRTAMNIAVQEIHNDGCLLSCSINACCLALMNCGLPMKYMFAATTIAISDSGDIVIDPSTIQLEDSVANVTLVYESKTNQLLSIDTQGTIQYKSLKDCMERGKMKCGHIFQLYRGHIEETV